MLGILYCILYPLLHMFLVSGVASGRPGNWPASSLANLRKLWESHTQTELVIDRSNLDSGPIFFMPAQERSLAKPGAMFWDDCGHAACCSGKAYLYCESLSPCSGGQCMVWAWKLKKAYEMIWIVPIRPFQSFLLFSDAHEMRNPLSKLSHQKCEILTVITASGPGPCFVAKNRLRETHSLSCWFPGPIRRLLLANITAGRQPKIWKQLHASTGSFDTT